MSDKIYKVFLPRSGKWFGYYKNGTIGAKVPFESASLVDEQEAKWIAKVNHGFIFMNPKGIIQLSTPELSKR